MEEYNLRFEEQGRACGCCHEPHQPGTKNLHVDHDHKWPYFKLDTAKRDGKWYSKLSPVQDAELFCAHAYHAAQEQEGKTKSEAIQKVRAILKTLSVRGLICFKCNTSIRKIYDNAKTAEQIAIYLSKHQKGT